MKRWITMGLAVVLALSLSACARQQTPPSQTQNKLPVDEKAKAEIRYGISLLLDRNYIAAASAQAGQQPASSFVAMGMTDADGSEFYENSGHDPAYAGYFDTAPEAYEENYAKGFSILRKYYHFDETTGKFTDFPTLTYLYNTSEAHKAIGEYVQMVLSSIGIPLQLENQEWSTFLNTRHEGNYSIARNGWVADYNDPMCFLDMWVSDSGNNDIGLGRGEHGKAAIYDLDLTEYGYDISVSQGTWSQTYDVLIGVIRDCTDPVTRYRLMHLAEDMLMSTGTVMPIYFYTDIYLLSDRVEGFFANPLGYKYFRNTTVSGANKEISVCLASEPETLDPALNATVDGATLVSHLFAGLARWEENEAGRLGIVADCASTLPEGVMNPDGTVTYTYTLKEDLKWSDGKPLTAEDFAYSWQRAASYALAADYGYMFEPIVGYEQVAKGEAGAKLAVEAVDDLTLTVTLNRPVHYWNELLAFPTYLPVRQDVVEGNEAWATDPKTYISNGPYTMGDWRHNSLITLQKNENYHDAPNVSMESIRFFLSDDANNMLTNFKNGTWLLIDDVPTNEIPALQQQYQEQFVISGQIGTYYLCWNANQDLKPRS